MNTPNCVETYVQVVQLVHRFCTKLWVRPACPKTEQNVSVRRGRLRLRFSGQILPILVSESQKSMSVQLCDIFGVFGLVSTNQAGHANFVQYGARA